jgi:hypothetical protein
VSRQAANGHRPAAPVPAADWAAREYQPGPAAPLLRCRCGAAWLDDDEGRHAHRVVFLHQPRAREEPATKEDPP